ncbi:CidA/LrgA family protein [Fusobacterium sp. IOR10]|uniref:CidA/LrgA family protein n=1 Tax=Fusobacterium sp. IOR10 TaxID=2665157 RepID=UPI0013D8117A|nr:CidA/LrgA family protein [Fusobacterium sp. IOR10]
MFIQLLILLSINFLGILLEHYFALPLPGTILGMFILFFLLYKKILNEKNIGEICDLLVGNMVILFIPPAINLLSTINLLKTDFFKIIFLLVITTLITMIITGKTVDFVIKRMEKR